jgi:hypothetical protein
MELDDLLDACDVASVHVKLSPIRAEASSTRRA